MKIDSLTHNLMANQTFKNMPSSTETNFDKILQQATNEKDNKKLYETCVELESVFLSKVLDAMRASIPRSDLINRSLAEETFESMLYDEYAKEMSKSNSVGIAQILYNQLKK